jgi:hypothetical protein
MCLVSSNLSLSLSLQPSLTAATNRIISNLHNLPAFRLYDFPVNHNMQTNFPVAMHQISSG